MGLLRILGSVGVALGAGVYLASFYTHVAAWRWSGVGVVAVSVGLLLASRLASRPAPTE